MGHLYTAFASAVGLLGCAPALVKHRIHQRDVELVYAVRITKLPPGSRLVHAASGSEPATVLANGREGSVELTFPYRAHEVVDNGSVSRNPAEQVVTLHVSAPGYLPKALVLRVPGTSEVDAQLTRPRFAAVDVGAAVAADADLALDHVASGRCADAVSVLERAKTRAADRSEWYELDEIVGGCVTSSPFAEPESLWSPSAFGVASNLTGSPAAALAFLEQELAKAQDSVGKAGLDRIVAEVARGRYSDAARIASLVARPLPAASAALVLQLPAALAARARLYRAVAALQAGDARAALAFATEARAIDPHVAPEIVAGIRTARVRQLIGDGENAERAGRAVLARAYFEAALLLADDSDVQTNAKAALERTVAAARAALRLRLAIVRVGGVDQTQEVRSLLAASLPPHVELVSIADKSDAVLSYSISEPEREHQFKQTERTTSVVLGTVPRPNPDYELAQQDVESAAERLDSAIESYEQLHQQAVDAANRAASMSGGFAVAMAGTAAAAEASGRALLKDAENDLRDAKAKLRTTPRTTTETVRRDARYPVIEISTTATMHLRFRLEGFDPPYEEAQDVSANLSAAHVEADPTLGVDGSRADAASHQSLQPDPAAALSQIAQRLAAAVHAAELRDAWGAYAQARDRNAVLAAAHLGAAYLVIGGDDAPHRAEVIEHLVRTLP